MSKADCAVVTYTAIFGSEKAPEKSKTPGSDEKNSADNADQADSTNVSDALDTEKEPVDLSGLKRPVMIVIVVLAMMLCVLCCVPAHALE